MHSTREKQKIFYSFLAKELIDNNYDSVGPGSGQCSRIEDAQEAQNQLMLTNNGLQTYRYAPHITPTKRRSSKGVVTKSLHQDKYRVCKKKISFVCSICKEENEGNGQHRKKAWICMTMIWFRIKLQA